ncbi:MAG: hypothetical protein ACI4PW_04230, partial [Alphaproteobacteria bacterium]
GTCETVSNHTCVAVSGCCTSDSGCSDSQKCSGNKCVAVPCSGTCMIVSNHACVRQSGCCTSNSDCSSGYRCASGRCTMKCISNDHCRSAAFCSGYPKSTCNTSSGICTCIR